MNSIVSALRIFFTHTVDRADLARKLVRLAHPRKLPVVLSRDEVARLLNATNRRVAPKLHRLALALLEVERESRALQHRGAGHLVLQLFQLCFLHLGLRALVALPSLRFPPRIFRA